MKLLKGILSIGLLTAFLSSVLGVQVYKHYCGSFLAEVSVFIQSNPCADENGEESCSKMAESSCCDDEVQLMQLDVDFQKTNSQRIQFNQLAFIPLTFISNSFKEELHEDFLILNFEDPPDIKELPLFKLYKHFKLYG